MSKVDVISLGCRLNIAESDEIAAMLPEESDLVVVNSCAVTNEAVRQTRQAIRKARRERPEARLLVTGCAAETEREAIAAMPEVDGLIANAAKLDTRSWNAAKGKLAVPKRHTRAFIGVQNGCDHACTFCIIPAGRGVSRSLPLADVLKLVSRHIDQGAREIILTGVDLTSWGHDLVDTPKLGRLVVAILKHFSDLPRLRLSSLDGIEVDEQLFEMLASEPRVMPHVHLSLQHGANLILKRMKRRHLREDAITLVERLKAHRAEISIGADLIAGFPTETDAHHQDNLSIIRELQIAHGHIFPFSPREGTPAARMPQHDRALIKARAAELRAEVAKVREKWLEDQLGKPHQVLVERDGAGYSENYARIAAPAGSEVGSIVTVTPQSHEKGLLR